MYDTYSYKCTHDMHKYDIKYNEDCFYNNKVQKFPLAFRKKNIWKIGTLYALQHVGTFIGTFARKNEKLAHFWYVRTQARWHVNPAGTQARQHVDHVDTQTRMIRDLANSKQLRNVESYKASS